MSIFPLLAALFRPAFFVWAVAVAYASLSPVRAIPETNWLAFENADKMIHFIMYFGFAMLAYFSYPAVHRQKWGKAGSFTAAVAYGGLMELAQGMFTVERTADWIDFFANSAGALLAVLLAGKCFALLVRQ